MMDRNTTLAFLLIGAILILWLYLNTPTPDSPPQTTEKHERVEEKPLPKPTEEIVKQDTAIGRYFTVTGEEEVITIENDFVILEMSSKGGTLKKYYLKEFNNWYSPDAEEGEEVYATKVQLINHINGSPFNLSFISSDGKKINTGVLGFSTDAPGYTRLSGEDSIVISYILRSGEQGEIERRYTFFGNRYSFQQNILFRGMNNYISNNVYDLVWENGIRFVEENSVDEAQYSNSSIFYGGEQVIIDAADVGEEIRQNYNGRVDWMAVRNKYFASIVIPTDPNIVEGAFIEGRRDAIANMGVRESYTSRLVMPFKNLAEEEHSFTVYIGPVDYDILYAYNRNLEAIVDFGSFFGLRFIVRPIAEYLLLPLFNFLHSFIPNYGFVIIVFALIIKIVLYPLTKQSYKSMKKMQLLQPKMTEIKEKYKEDPQKMNKEMMKLYSTYGVNPAGGCFPLLLQMPIFIALWGLFQVAIDLRQAEFLFWIKDLSRPDIIANLPFSIPFFNISHLSGLALLMGLTTFIQQKMTIKDPKQQMLVYVMPVMLTVMFMSFPSGLNLYYFMFNLFTIIQQYWINHSHSDMELKPVENPKKKGGFMSKLMEAAEQQQKQQAKKKR
jgi:YidC/Oxa1 family membrane protein insertase